MLQDKQTGEEETEGEALGLFTSAGEKGVAFVAGGAWSAGRLGYRVPPAAISRSLIAGRTGD
jgi:hypothetical protein